MSIENVRASPEYQSTLLSFDAFHLVANLLAKQEIAEVLSVLLQRHPRSD
jgi:hypothetical protein